MKFKFKVQEYQTNAINSVIKVFNGQLKYENFTYKWWQKIWSFRWQAQSNTSQPRMRKTSKNWSRGKANRDRSRL